MGLQSIRIAFGFLKRYITPSYLTLRLFLEIFVQKCLVDCYIVAWVEILLNVNYETSISTRLYTTDIIYQTLLSLWHLTVSRDFLRFSPLQNVVKSKWQKLLKVTDMNVFCLVSIKSQPNLTFQYSISRNVTSFNAQSLLLVRHSALRCN